MSRRSAATRQGFNQYMRSQEDSTFSSPAVRNPLAIDQHLSSTLPIPSNPFAIPSSPPPIPSNPFVIDQRPSSTFRTPNNPPAIDRPRPSHPAFDRADDDRWRQLNSVCGRLTLTYLHTRLTGCNRITECSRRGSTNSTPSTETPSAKLLHSRRNSRPPKTSARISSEGCGTLRTRSVWLERKQRRQGT
jgi:hypothetical protein